MTQVNAYDIKNHFYVSTGDEYGLPEVCMNEEEIEALLSQVRAQAHAEGRREGLKQMDETWDSWYSGYYVRDLLVERHTNFPEDDGNLLKLREEYQQPA